MKPCAKQAGVLSESVEDEVIVYDPERKRGHCLNRTAALVWRHADGEHTIAELAAMLRRQLDPVADEHLVWHALDQLDAAHLLAEPLARSADEMRASRRRFIRKVGLIGAASLLLPVVSSITAPAGAGVVSGTGGNCHGPALFVEWLRASADATEEGSPISIRDVRPPTRS
jgi:hypothetical protein